MSDINPRPYVSVIIPLHNQTDLLMKLLGSIWAEDMPPGSYEVVVTDDGSRVPAADEILRVPGSAGRPIRVFRNEKPQGAAAARNRAADEAQGEVLLFLDADTVIEKGTLRRTYDRFRREPDLGAFNGGAALEPANPEDGFTPKYRALMDHVQQNTRAPQTCSLFTPRLGAVRKKYFDACGRFDAWFPGASVEEYEFGHRLSRICPIEFDGQTNVRHHYQKFRKNCRNFYSRVRMWMPLFWGRRRFENFGSVTGSYGIGSAFGALAALLIPLMPLGILFQAAFLVSLAGFIIGYAELFMHTIRLKGVLFLVPTVLLSWWLCIFILAGAVMGTLDVLTGCASRSAKTSTN